MSHDTYTYTTSIDRLTGAITVEISSPHDLEELADAFRCVHYCFSTGYGRSICVVAVDAATGERAVLNDPDGDACEFTLELMRIQRELVPARYPVHQSAFDPYDLFDLNQYEGVSEEETSSPN